MDTNRPGITLAVLVSVSAILYIYIGYFLARHEAIPLIVSYMALFAIYWKLYSFYQMKLSHLVGIGIIFRLLLLLSFPTLSDDIYRFVWDGKLIANGIHPFAHLPSDLMESGNLPTSLDPSLYDRLNSPNYFTIYPPLAQFLFWLAAVGVDSVFTSAVIIRLFIIGAELGSIFLLVKLTDIYGVKTHRIALYALNPLVILELTGNLHFESFMIFFLLLLVYLYKRKKLLWSGVSMGLAICAKLIPFMFLPLFLRKLRFSNALIFYGVTLSVVVLCFLPLFDLALFKGMYSSLSLYFQKFEFNASIYYLVREVGYWVKGYNVISSSGPWLSVISLVLILLVSFFLDPKKNSTPEMFFWVLFIYLLFTTTVHPWYITTLVALSVFTRYRFVIAWSGVIFMTYVGYSETTFEENMLIVLLEYATVFVLATYELYQQYKKVKFNAFQALG